MPEGRLFAEAYNFERDAVFILRHLQLPNSSESVRRQATRLLSKVLLSLYSVELASLEQRRNQYGKEEWLAVGRPTLERLRADLKKYRAQIPRYVEKNVWRP